jgi:ATP-dependent Lon protease
MTLIHKRNTRSNRLKKPDTLNKLDELDDLDNLDESDESDESDELDESDMDDLYGSDSDSDELDKKSPEFKKWLSSINMKIKSKKVKMEDIMDLNLSDEVAIWFVEHIKILDNMDRYSEEYYTMKEKIYNKYIDYKNTHHIEILNKLKEMDNNNVDILTRIAISEHPDDIKSLLYKRYNLINDGNKSDEYFKVIDWIDTVLDIPIKNKISLNGTTDITEMIYNLKKKLDEKVFGLDNVKEKIIETYCSILTNPLYKKKFIALVGPPGTGKTELGKTIAESFDLPFNQISFGGIKDASVLTGHSFTYIGARPGLFVTIMRHAKYLNNVILLDEIDKINNSQEGSSISSVLLHVLDKTQNTKFSDMYMPEVPINLSNVFFILAMNSDEHLDPILKDRLCIINIDGYDLNEKIIIGKNYVLPKIRQSLLFKDTDIIIDDICMKYIIDKTVSKSDMGIRSLENSITTIIERLNVLKNIQKTSSNNKKLKLSYAIDNIKFPLNLDKKTIDILLS